MSIRFAAAGAGECGAVARVLRRPRLRAPANDHDNQAESDTMLHEALQHFARHGLGAAERARNIALRAFFEGNREQYRHWLGICRKLDRQMANRLATAHGAVEEFEPLILPE
ncbi:hypothetical protein [Novosphingobium sediminicola]|uniref:Uncharacterized protein n=1 Tax=Novosphingobium sediminicola TaxID=563162 RepID=A0A7W6CJJ7_9SPHN|nr:hypothetical protein [Novosphingobium sediminicola]MBB3955834.1 hypothetical protein [Novosphingobium sediminicola]